MLTWEQPHCQPFRDLLAHPKMIPYMNTFFGRGWKMDHHPVMITGAMHPKQGKDSSLDKGNFHGGTAVGTGGGGTMHGSTARIHNGSQYYTYANGTMRNGMIVAAFQLRTINEGDGGFCDGKGDLVVDATSDAEESDAEPVFAAPERSLEDPVAGAGPLLLKGVVETDDRLQRRVVL